MCVPQMYRIFAVREGAALFATCGVTYEEVAIDSVLTA